MSSFAFLDEPGERITILIDGQDGTHERYFDMDGKPAIESSGLENLDTGVLEVDPKDLKTGDYIARKDKLAIVLDPVERTCRQLHSLKIKKYKLRQVKSATRIRTPYPLMHSNFTPMSIVASVLSIAHFYSFKRGYTLSAGPRNIRRDLKNMRLHDMHYVYTSIIQLIAKLCNHECLVELRNDMLIITLIDADMKPYRTFVLYDNGKVQAYETYNSANTYRAGDTSLAHEEHTVLVEDVLRVFGNRPIYAESCDGIVSAISSIRHRNSKGIE